METTNVDEQAQNMAAEPILCEGESVGEVKAIRIDEKDRVEATAAAEEPPEKRARVHSDDPQPPEPPISIKEARSIIISKKEEFDAKRREIVLELIPKINSGIRAKADQGLFEFKIDIESRYDVRKQLKALYTGFSVIKSGVTYFISWDA